MDIALEHLRKQNYAEVEKSTKAKEMQAQSIESAEKELNALTKMRYRELIDDTTFITERDLLQTTITKLKKQLEDTTDHSAKWIDLTERAFRFATYAKYHFQKGSLEQKKEILAALGSNYTLKDKKLSIEAVEWLQVIDQCLPPLIAEFKRIEPIQSPYFERWKTAFDSLVLTWCRRGDSNSHKVALDRF